MSNAPFYIQVGMSPAMYHQRNQHYSNKSIDKQPAGLNFYEQSWNVKQTGTVYLDHGKYSVTIPYVLSSVGTEDVDYSDRGIYDFSVNSGLNADEFISHDQARLLFFERLKKILELGWQFYIPLYEPRLLGQQSFLFAVEDSVYGPDPRYLPSLDEWMQLGSGHRWVFFAEDVFLTVGFRRKSQFMDAGGEGVYLLNYTIVSKNAHARDSFTGDDREQWQDLWVEKSKKRLLKRYQKEAELIKKRGYHIFTDYQDAKIHPDDPVEPDNAQEYLDFIRQNNPGYTE